jgi:hypothetical protein
MTVAVDPVSPAPPMVPGIPDPILAALIAVIGVFFGAAVALVGHLLIARTANKNRIWSTVWPEKAEAYKSLLAWSQNSGGLSPTEVWIEAQIYASDEVREIINEYLSAGDDADAGALRDKLGPAVRRDLKTNIELK